MSAHQDRNFDDLAHRFKRNVYDRLKGDIRLAVLERDLKEFLAAKLYPEAGAEVTKPLRILDAGGGQGQFSLPLAQLGHTVVLCDISAEMLKLAQANAECLGVTERVQLHHGAIQQLRNDELEGFDLVLCHAVLEWVAEPRQLLAELVALLKPGGYMSLTWYNVNSIIMKNLLRTNFNKVIDEDYQGYRGSLTPTWPRRHEEVTGWLQELPLELLCESGIRCFHDYILEPGHRGNEPGKQLTLELRLSRQEPWRSLGRYLHALSRKSLA
ncbi:MAG: methyltransferase domain-containing protein [Gammaproteobacteria bacterium]|uniref:methyltransferase domain-containing protein n=1 Tax=Pseudomaricurvus alcaniphilus TaxID=1166482 RepID=UPI001408AB19|nr:methyltransferase domain-containing protein [Pseudomaricurvus alcaniphilus]MBR9912164.1 methyltransferase domain-containing protein [Gammaproteobacteria bacterium]NHN35696.1 methyltransferase domain-containing protein [Pseudomaricurvus alcaniphilus]